VLALLAISSPQNRYNSIHLAPRMLENLVDVVSLRQIPVKHLADKVDALVADRVRYPQVAIHDLVDAVEGILLVYNSIEENAEGPHILLLASVWLSGKNFGGCVVLIQNYC
jgi:hypothetical protein